MVSVEQKFNSIELLITQLQVTKSNLERITLIENISLQLTDVDLYHYFGTSSYGRNLVFTCDDFEVVLMCWRPGHHCASHDHNGSLCVMKCLAGTLDEQRFHKNRDCMTAIGKYQITAGSTASITDEQRVHSIANFSADNAWSLHFYFPPIHNVNIYDLDRGEPKKVASIFTSKFGNIL